MGNPPGPANQQERPRRVDDGTLPRRQGNVPGPVGIPTYYLLKDLEQWTRTFGFSSSSAHPIIEDSVEGKNVKAAAEFIRSMGQSPEADSIIGLLRRGYIAWDETEEDRGDTGTIFGWITLGSGDGDVLPALRTRALDGSKLEDFRGIVALSRTLLHERIHSADQNYLRMGAGMSVSGAVGLYRWAKGEKFTRDHWRYNEHEAWSRTLLALEKWAIQYQRQVLAIADDRIDEKLDAWQRFAIVEEQVVSVVRGFIGSNGFGAGEENLKQYRAALTNASTQLAEARKEIQALTAKKTAPSQPVAVSAPVAAPAAGGTPDAPAENHHFHGERQCTARTGQQCIHSGSLQTCWSSDCLNGGKILSCTYNAKLRLYDCHHQYYVRVPK